MTLMEDTDFRGETDAASQHQGPLQRCAARAACHRAVPPGKEAAAGGEGC